MDRADVPPVFIVGCYRSGTSLLRLMLSAHSRISISSEGAYIYHVLPKLASYGDLTESENLEVLYRDALPLLRDEQWVSEPPFDELLSWVRQYGAGWPSIMRFYGTWEGRVIGKRELVWWGDNAPYHVHNIPYFASLFPESRFILMIRDPRDVYTSIKVNYKERYPLPDVISVWERALLDGLLAKSVVGAARMAEVRYEALVTRPRRQLEEICSFLGVQYEEHMLNYYESEAARALSRIPHHRNVVMPVSRGSVGSYRSALTEEEITEINRRVASPARCLGYVSEAEYQQILGI